MPGAPSLLAEAGGAVPFGREPHRHKKAACDPAGGSPQPAPPGATVFRPAGQSGWAHVRTCAPGRGKRESPYAGGLGLEACLPAPALLLPPLRLFVVWWFSKCCCQLVMGCPACIALEPPANVFRVLPCCRSCRRRCHGALCTSTTDDGQNVQRLQQLAVALKHQQ